jgi:ferredoxin
MSWSIEVDANTCIGSGMCVGSAPDHFDLEDGVSRVLTTPCDPADEVLDASESCPVEAITVRDSDTGKVLAPQE